jgi:hypothetical protein
LFAVLVLFLYRAIVSERYYQYFHRPTRFAIGQSYHTFPVAGYEFLARELDGMAHMAMFGDTKSADMFLNRFGPEWQTYIDGRHAEVYDAPFFATYGNALGLRGPFFSEAGKYGIGLAVFGTCDIPPGGGDLQKDIYLHPGWRLVYLDDCACIFAAAVPSNAAVVAQNALPFPLAAMSEQERVYAEWLQRTGHTRYDLYEPGNNMLDTSRPARLVCRVFQLGGLWAPAHNHSAWNRARVAAFLSKLGWAWIADNIYDMILREDPLHVTVAEEAINHAITCFDACQTPEAKNLFLDRIQFRSTRLGDHTPAHPTAQYGLAFVESKQGEQLAAVTRLTALKQSRKDAVILDLLACLYGELGDMAKTSGEKERLWKLAVRSWRDRLTRYPVGPNTYRAYLRLGDLFQRLNKPLLARANYVNALNEPDIPPVIADRAREHVKRIEKYLFGMTFVPNATQAVAVAGPFNPPVDISGAYSQAPADARADDVPMGGRRVPGSALPARVSPGQPEKEKQPVFPPLVTNTVEVIRKKQPGNTNMPAEVKDTIK